MTERVHDMVKRLLDGEVRLADLPPALRAEGEEALRLLAAVDRAAVTLPEDLEARVMAAVRRRAASPARRAWRWLGRAREVRVRLRPVPAGAVLAAAAALAIVLGAPGPAPEDRSTQAFVRFTLYAPDARQVTVAGTFNYWDYRAAPMFRAGGNGLWVATLPLAVGQHQYVFVVDGSRVVTDPAAPAVDDGFGARNSVVAVSARGATL